MPDEFNAKSNFDNATDGDVNGLDLNFDKKPKVAGDKVKRRAGPVSVQPPIRAYDRRGEPQEPRWGTVVEANAGSASILLDGDINPYPSVPNSFNLAGGDKAVVGFLNNNNQPYALGGTSSSMSFSSSFLIDTVHGWTGMLYDHTRRNYNPNATGINDVVEDSVWTSVVSGYNVNQGQERSASILNGNNVVTNPPYPSPCLIADTILLIYDDLSEATVGIDVTLKNIPSSTTESIGGTTIELETNLNINSDYYANAVVFRDASIRILRGLTNKYYFYGLAVTNWNEKSKRNTAQANIELVKYDCKKGQIVWRQDFTGGKKIREGVYQYPKDRNPDGSLVFDNLTYLISFAADPWLNKNVDTLEYDGLLFMLSVYKGNKTSGNCHIGYDFVTNKRDVIAINDDYDERIQGSVQSWNPYLNNSAHSTPHSWSTLNQIYPNMIKRGELNFESWYLRAISMKDGHVVWSLNIADEYVRNNDNEKLENYPMPPDYSSPILPNSIPNAINTNEYIYDKLMADYNVDGLQPTLTNFRFPQLIYSVSVEKDNNNNSVTVGRLIFISRHIRSNSYVWPHIKNPGMWINDPDPAPNVVYNPVLNKWEYEQAPDRVFVRLAWQQMETVTFLPSEYQAMHVMHVVDSSSGKVLSNIEINANAFNDNNNNTSQISAGDLPISPSSPFSSLTMTNQQMIDLSEQAASDPLGWSGPSRESAECMQDRSAFVSVRQAFLGSYFVDDVDSSGSNPYEESFQIENSTEGTSPYIYADISEVSLATVTAIGRGRFSESITGNNDWHYRPTSEKYEVFGFKIFETNVGSIPVPDWQWNGSNSTSSENIFGSRSIATPRMIRTRKKYRYKINIKTGEVSKTLLYSASNDGKFKIEVTNDIGNAMTWVPVPSVPYGVGSAVRNNIYSQIIDQYIPLPYQSESDCQILAAGRDFAVGCRIDVNLQNSLGFKWSNYSDVKRKQSIVCLDLSSMGVIWKEYNSDAETANDYPPVGFIGASSAHPIGTFYCVINGDDNAIIYRLLRYTITSGTPPNVSTQTTLTPQMAIVNRDGTSINTYNLYPNPISAINWSRVEKMADMHESLDVALEHGFSWLNTFIVDGSQVYYITKHKTRDRLRIIRYGNKSSFSV